MLRRLPTNAYHVQRINQINHKYQRGTDNQTNMNRRTQKKKFKVFIG